MSEKRSRLEVGAEKTFVTMQYFSEDYKSIIREKDKSFYNSDKSLLDNLSSVIKEYSADDFWCLNDFLREGKVEKFSKSELKSWTYSLHSSLKVENSNVKNGTIVYKGVKLPPPKNLRVGNRFYFPEFVSTSLNLETAKKFAKRKDNTYGTILVIKIKNNGVNNRLYYCRNIEEITQFHGEDEIMITAFCIFQITRIDGNTIYLDCEGY